MRAFTHGLAHAQDGPSAEAALSSKAQSGSVRLVDDDGDSAMDSEDSDDTTTAPEPSADHPMADAPSGPSFTSIGSPAVPTPSSLRGKAPAQLPHELGGDAPPAVAKVEGLMDGSEDPMKL